MLSDLFEFKLIFVRELVPFEKWYQEAILRKKKVYERENQRRCAALQKEDWNIISYYYWC